MVFLCTLYIFKGTHTRSMDCGVKKVCEGLKHRMVRASLTVHVSEWIECTRQQMGTEKNKKKKTKSRKLETKINSSTVRILLKANREKKLYIQTYRCVYISFSAWALNDVIAGIRRPKSEPKNLPPPSPHPWVLGANKKKWWWKKRLEY